VEGFLRLHEEAAELIRNRPREAARTIADLVGIVDPELVLDALFLSPKYCAKLSEAYVSSTMKFVPVLRKLGYIHRDVARERIFFPELIDKVHPEKDHYGEGIANA
jgi:NitT/TauT family transport system substrate-binding protein